MKRLYSALTVIILSSCSDGDTKIAGNTLIFPNPGDPIWEEAKKTLDKAAVTYFACVSSAVDENILFLDNGDPIFIIESSISD